jgi:hypothetical protein
VDNQVAVQEQNEKSIAYVYDPVGRTMTAKMTTKSGSTTAISHYAGPGDALTWTCEEVGECKEEKETKWTRNIPASTEHSTRSRPTAGRRCYNCTICRGTSWERSATTKVKRNSNTPTSAPNLAYRAAKKPRQKYAWLGAEGAESELGTGVITKAVATYVPQLARTLQAEQVIPPGAAPNGTGPGGLYITEESATAIESGNAAAANALAEQRALE